MINERIGNSPDFDEEISTDSEGSSSELEGDWCEFDETGVFFCQIPSVPVRHQNAQPYQE